MITEVWLDETVDEEVFVLDVHDGPLWFAVEGDFGLDAVEWFISWVAVPTTDWFDCIIPNGDPGNIDLQWLDPRFIEALLNAPVTQWKWS